MRLWIFISFLLIVLNWGVSGDDPNQLYSCVDWECEEWISRGKTLLLYSGRTEKHLSFKKNEDILIVGKPVGNSQDWIGKVGKRTGLVPKDMVREDKMNKIAPKFKVSLGEIWAAASNVEVEDTVQPEDDEEEEADFNEDDFNEVGIEDVDDAIEEAVSPPSNESEKTLDPQPVENKPNSFAEQMEAKPSDASPPVQASAFDNQTEEEQPKDIIPSSTDSTVLPLDLQTPDPEIVDVTPSPTQIPVETLHTLEPQLSSNDEVEIKSEAATTIEEISSAIEPEIADTKEESLPPTEAEADQVPTLSDSVPENSETFDAQLINDTQSSTTEASIDTEKSVPELSPLPVEDIPEAQNELNESLSVGDSQSVEGTPPLPPVPIETLLTEGADSESQLPEIVAFSPESQQTLEPPLFEPTKENGLSQTKGETDDMEPEKVLVPEQEGEQEDLQRVEKVPVPEQEAEQEEHVEMSTTQSPEEVVAEVVTESLPPPTEDSLKEEDDNQQSSDQSPAKVDEKSPEVVEELLPEPDTGPVEVEESSTSSPPDSPLDPQEKENVEEEVLPDPDPVTEEVVSTTPVPEETQTDERVGHEVPEVHQDNQVHDDHSYPTVDTVESQEKSAEEAQPQPEPADAASPILESQPSDSSPSFPSVDTEPNEKEVTETIPAEPSAEATTPQMPTEPIVASPTEDHQSVDTPFIPEETIEVLNEEKVADDAPQEVIDVPPMPESPSDHEHDSHDHHHHHHHHHKRHFKDVNDTESSSIILVIKHLSSTLLSFLPEPLQDTILDVDDALVFTGIIALTLVSICVPYFFIEGLMSVRPLKKKVVELNKSLWKVSAAYETQQEEFEVFKQKAIAHDEFKRRAEQSENDVIILKKLETKHREQITTLKNQLKSQMKEAVDIRGLIEKALEAKKVVSDECEKYKAWYETAKESLAEAKEELNNIQTHAKSSALLLNVSGKNVEVLNSKIKMLESEAGEMKAQLISEIEKRKRVEKSKEKVEESKIAVEKDLFNFKNICHQYESTVNNLNEEISKLDSELITLKETLGEDSPLLEVAEVQAKAAFAEKEVASLRTRLDGVTADNDNLSRRVKLMVDELEEAREEKEETNNRLQVLEKYFKEREEEYMKTIEELQLKESVRDKGKEELIKIIEEKENACKDLNKRLEDLKDEFEETKQQHRNEIRALEGKGHESWLSLCQAERKAQDARKEAKLLRQRLTALTKERDEDGDGLNNDVPFPVLPDELVPLPLMDESPSYFGLGDNFIPPPPLPEDSEREARRPPPLGGRLSPSFSDFGDDIPSPIGVGRDEDCSDSSGSNSPRRSPPLRGGWVNVVHGQGQRVQVPRATSSPLQPGANL